LIQVSSGGGGGGGGKLWAGGVRAVSDKVIGDMAEKLFTRNKSYYSARLNYVGGPAAYCTVFESSGN